MFGGHVGSDLAVLRFTMCTSYSKTMQHGHCEAIFLVGPTLLTYLKTVERTSTLQGWVCDCHHDMGQCQCHVGHCELQLGSTKSLRFGVTSTGGVLFLETEFILLNTNLHTFSSSHVTHVQNRHWEYASVFGAQPRYGMQVTDTVCDMKLVQLVMWLGKVQWRMDAFGLAVIGIWICWISSSLDPW